MTSKIKVDNINKVSDDSNIIKKCGSTTTVGSGSGQTIVVDGATVTLGRCGGAVNLASGATQTGFGASGAVTWDTTVKTADFTATSGTGFFVDTSGSAKTVTLPASPSAGNIVAIADYAGTASTNNITIARNGSNFEGAAQDGKVIVDRQVFTLVYVDSTQGWVSVAENDSSAAAPKYVTATGGTVTTAGCGNVKIHTFTSPGTFCISCAGNPLGNSKLNYLVIAGGGSGGGPFGRYENGGGGAGGYREANDPEAGSPYASSFLANTSGLNASAGPISVTVGAGGAVGSAGSNSVFSTITSAGGARGPGDEGAGGSGSGGSNGACGSAGNTPPVSPPQGNPGGKAGGSPPANAFGGGGGGAARGGGPESNPGGPGTPGGDGLANSITDSLVTRAGGGGGSGPSQGSGGSGGGGQGASNSPPSPGDAGTVNTGGGGGGGYNGNGGVGGSGIVVIRYKFQN
jgi:hypothetical protein